MNLQMENQLLQGNQAALGSPLGRSITLVNDILYFMDLKMEIRDTNMKLLGSPETVSEWYHGSPNGEPYVLGKKQL